jgi:hypothetical protein
LAVQKSPGFAISGQIIVAGQVVELSGNLLYVEECFVVRGLGKLAYHQLGKSGGLLLVFLQGCQYSGLRYGALGDHEPLRIQSSPLHRLETTVLVHDNV